MGVAGTCQGQRQDQQDPLLAQTGETGAVEMERRWGSTGRNTPPPMRT